MEIDPETALETGPETTSRVSYHQELATVYNRRNSVKPGAVYADMNPVKSPPVLQCGMYAFSPELKNAWTALFRNLHEYLPAPFNTPVTLRFDCGDAALKSTDLLLGHTCGYPFITKLHHTHEPVCVPEFDLAGCNGIHYSSWIIARKSHPGMCLNDFSGSIATCNSRDSNSGMNVFRYEVSRITNGAPFFRQILMSGSHLTSIRNIMQGQADIAAIDAVTWHFVNVQNLTDIPKVRIIGQTVPTPGLPFVKSNRTELDPFSFTRAINACLEDLPVNIRSFLRIKQFSVIDADTYRPVLELEEYARNNHYPELA